MDAPRVFTIGHSNHSADIFFDLLRQHAIEVVVDTRSQPRSKYSPQFDTEALKVDLPRIGIKYLFMGKELGGRPEGAEYYDPEGHVLYDRVADSRCFQDGLARLMNGIGEFRVAMMCSEENPAACHRRLLVGRVLGERGVEVIHIRGDGRLLPETELAALESAGDDQLALFEYTSTPEWKSVPSVLPKKRPSGSSPL